MAAIAAGSVAAMLGGSTSAPPRTQPAHATLPAIWPTPRQLTPHPGALPVTDTVTVVRGPHTDQAALTALGSVLRASGASTVTEIGPGDRVPSGTLTVYLGTPADDQAIGPALRTLGAPDPAGLPAGGYVLAVGRDRDVVVAGADAAGTFYAVQTLRQLISGRALHDVVIRDWPELPVRGVIEGFYGPSWSGAQIAGQLAFYGANKLNTFVYSAKNDPYLRADWRRLYPAARLTALAGLARDASAAHVSFVYALSPGLSVCYSGPADLRALEAKDQQLWDAGVRQFAVFFDDIGGQFGCTGDTSAFGASADPLAAAQAYLLNRFVADFLSHHHGAGQLITVPTDYTGDSGSAYRAVWKASLNSRVLVYWTGTGVIPPTITAAQAAATAREFGHPIVVWDNYPVNDYQPTRLFLGPLTGRAPNLGTAVAGFTSNPMQEPGPSMIPLSTTADYTWNPAAYDSAPQAAWSAAITAYGGPAASALGVFTEDNQSTARIGTLPEAPRLAAAISAFWAAYRSGRASPASPALRAAAARLSADWQQVAATPQIIQRTLPHQDFVAEAGPWLALFRSYGLAGDAAVRYLMHEGARGPVEKYYAQVTSVPQVVGEGVFRQFLLSALSR